MEAGASAVPRATDDLLVPVPLLHPLSLSRKVGLSFYLVLLSRSGSSAYRLQLILQPPC
jgi:hypothetical protein